MERAGLMQESPRTGRRGTVSFADPNGAAAAAASPPAVTTPARADASEEHQAQTLQLLTRLKDQQERMVVLGEEHMLQVAAYRDKLAYLMGKYRTALEMLANQPSLSPEGKLFLDTVGMEDAPQPGPRPEPDSSSSSSSSSHHHLLHHHHQKQHELVPSAVRKVGSGSSMSLPMVPRSSSILGLDEHQQSADGLGICGRFFAECVRPIVEEFVEPGYYSAALLGLGSEVLGFDTPQSRDHDWGMRVLIFLDEDMLADTKAVLLSELARRLPATFEGWPTTFAPNSDGTRVMGAPFSGSSSAPPGTISHGVRVLTVEGFLNSEQLGVEASAVARGELTSIQWLTLPQQRLLSVVSGRVYHDGLGTLTRCRAALAWFPTDVWRYLVAARLGRISQEHAFVGRCGQVGDDLGSRVVAARLVREMMLLALLLEKQYAPYSKWLGSAFARLGAVATLLRDPLEAALAASTWHSREASLADCYEILGARLHSCGVLPKSCPRPQHHTKRFHGRPFTVSDFDAEREALLASITDQELARLVATRGCIGSVDMFTDCVEISEDHNLAQRLRVVL